MRTYDSNQNQPDYELEKFVIFSRVPLPIDKVLLILVVYENIITYTVFTVS